MNFTNYYTFHITRHITRKPNNRLANQPFSKLYYASFSIKIIFLSRMERM